MKKFTAILCILCMIATLVPFSAMAEDEVTNPAVTTIWNWSGSADNAMKYSSTDKGAVTIQYATKDNSDYAHSNGMIGGKAEDDYYTNYNYSTNYLLYWLSASKAELTSNYTVVKYNVYSDHAALYLDARVVNASGKGAYPVIYKFTTADNALFETGVWNSCMIVIDNANNKSWAYINGVRTAEYSFVSNFTNVKAEYTSLSASGTDRFRLKEVGVNTVDGVSTLNVDDFVVFTSTTEPVSPKADVTSSGLTYGGNIISKETVINLASDGNTVIVSDGTTATRAATTATTDNIVSVEYSDSVYGTMYQNYIVKDNIKTVFWDGAAAPSSAYGVMFANGATQSYVADQLGGKAADDKYMSFTTKVSGDYPFFYKSSNSFTTRYCTFSLNVYGKAFDYTFVRFSSKDTPAITPGLNNYLSDDKWNNIFIVCDNTTKDVHTYVNNVLVGTKNLTTACESYGTLSADKTKYTSKNDSKEYTIAFSDVRLKFVHDSVTTSYTWCTDDFAVMYTDYEPTPAAYATVSVDSNASISGKNIVINLGNSNATVNADGAQIMVKHNGTWSDKSDVVVGDEVAVITSTPYGNIFDNYTVTRSTYNKFYDGTAESAGVNATYGFGFSHDPTAVETAALDGKLEGESYNKKVVIASGEDVFYTGGKNTFSTRYCTISFNVYGKGIQAIFARMGIPKDGGGEYTNIKPNLLDGTDVKAALYDNQWNNVFLVYDSQTKACTTYVNGVIVSNVNLYDTIKSIGNKISDIDRENGTFAYKVDDSTTVTDINVSIADTRIRFTNGATTYFDDCATFYTDYEPVPCSYATITGAAVDGRLIVIDGETAEISGATVVVDNAVTNTLSVGDKAVIVTNTPYGNIYKTYTVISKDITTTSIADMTNGLSFVQGGRPWIVDESLEAGGYNVEPTGTGNDVLISNVENVFGSKLDMKQVEIGYNDKSSVQTYYQTTWNKSTLETTSNYLVIEADIAFPNSGNATGFKLSTNTGNGISSDVGVDHAYVARVNHYLWVYDIDNGTYVDYMNGKPLVEAPVAVLADFKVNSYNALRIGFNGKTKMSTNGTYGTYTETLKAYINNVKVYGSVEVPSPKVGAVMTGAIGNRFYPVCDTSDLTIEYIKNTLVNDADANVYVYTNRTYIDEITSADATAGYFYMVVTEKDGVCNYYRVCRMPNADATYAIETISPDADAVSVIVINIGKTQDMALVLAETNGDNFVRCNVSTNEAVGYGENIAVRLEGITSGNNVTLYGWDNFDDITPLGDAVVVK